jgi:dTDP-4-dehydrorhamnose reductase
MDILILGHKGYLGSYLYEHIDSDILENRNVYNNGKCYDYIINCIGKVNLEYCEKNERESEECNLQIAEDITSLYPSSKIISFSSYYVYDDEGRCTEDSKVTYKYNYTRHKLLSEKIVSLAGGVSFRVGKLFGNESKNSNRLTGYILDNKEAKLDNVLFNPASTRQVLDVIKWELDNDKLTGVYNLANKETCTHYEYGVYLNSLLGNKKTIINATKMPRIFHNYGKFAMSLSKIQRIVKLRSWKQDLKNFVENYV